MNKPGSTYSQGGDYQSSYPLNQNSGLSSPQRTLNQGSLKIGFWNSNFKLINLKVTLLINNNNNKEMSMVKKWEMITIMVLNC